MIRRVGNRHILPIVLAGVVRRAVREPRTFREQVVKEAFIALKRFGAPRVRSIEVAEIPGIADVLVTGEVTRHACGPPYDALVLAALCRVLECRTVFEIGTYHGETAWLVAHNNPDVIVYTIDLAGIEAAQHTALELTDRNYFRAWERGARFHGTPEAGRIVQLYGDSAKFDYSPYRQRIDLVFIDASHSYSYVKSDTEAALSMLSERGIIVWDDYTHYAGIYAYLHELAPQLGGTILHLMGTRLAIYRRIDEASSIGRTRQGLLR
jgi:predicted O-methyltransferase YrrM